MIIYLFCEQFHIGRIIVPHIIYSQEMSACDSILESGQVYHRSLQDSRHFPHPHPDLPEVRFLMPCDLDFFCCFSTNLNIRKDNKRSPSIAFGKPLKILRIPPTIPGHPSRNGSGTVSCGISNRAHNARILNFLSCTRGSPSLVMTANQRSKKLRAVPGLLASIKCSAAEGL